jgi:protein-S-isoprenylcysteine O-methyltransferase Ste14/SAM-dependent methyltransferase
MNSDGDAVLKNIMTRQGHWLFRWGHYLPLLALPLAIQTFLSSGWMTQKWGMTGERAWDVLCVSVALSGLAIRVLTVGFGTFGQAHPYQENPSRNATGLYSVLRHPLYFGNFFVFVGLVLLLKSGLFLLFAIAGYLAYYERIVLAKEETLAEQYGEDFAVWAARTPLVVPRLSNWVAPGAPFSWRTAIKREYRTLFLIAVVFFISESLESLLLDGTTFRQWLAVEPQWAWFAGMTGLLYIPAMFVANATTWPGVSGQLPASTDFSDRKADGAGAAYSARVRYSEKVSKLYQQRNPRRHHAEMQLLSRVFAQVPLGSVLDIPSGGGRVGVLLAQHQYQVTCADYSPAMVDITRHTAAQVGVDIAVDQQDIEAMTYADRAFDTIVCFRLFHHFPNRAIRARAVREMCRVARDRVVVSYFSPLAFSALERKARGTINGRQSKFTTSLNEVCSYFEDCGFVLEKDFSQLPLLRTLHVGLFRRAG